MIAGSAEAARAVIACADGRKVPSVVNPNVVTQADIFNDGSRGSSVAIENWEAEWARVGA